MYILPTTTYSTTCTCIVLTKCGTCVLFVIDTGLDEALNVISDGGAVFLTGLAVICPEGGSESPSGSLMYPDSSALLRGVVEYSLIERVGLVTEASDTAS